MTLQDYLEDRSHSEFARGIGVSPGMIFQWLNGIRPVSAKKARAIDRYTGGVVSKESLCPEIFGEQPSREAA